MSLGNGSGDLVEGRRLDVRDSLAGPEVNGVVEERVEEDVGHLHDKMEMWEEQRSQPNAKEPGLGVGRGEGRTWKGNVR
jgi:hypothetical protein